MSFQYDLTTTGTALAVSKIRLHIGDTFQGTGVLPNNNNFSNEELYVFYADNGSNVMAGAAGAMESLARTWARFVDTQAGPLRISASQAALRYARLAQELRQQAGGAYQSFSGHLQRQDGYAYRAGSVDVAP